MNLVDNMVKLGSLYRAGAPNQGNGQLRDKLEFNHRVQEQRLLAEERKEWERISPDHNQLQVLLAFLGIEKISSLRFSISRGIENR